MSLVAESPRDAAARVPPARQLRVAAALMVLPLVALIWADWPVVVDLVRNWQNDPDYSAGMLVLPAAIYLAWRRRAELANVPIRPAWLGLLIVAAGIVVTGAGTVYLYESLERYGLVLALIGVVVVVLGKALAWRLRWVLLFLLVMVPLPGRVHNLVAAPLQAQATAGTLFLLELAGIPTSRSGNILLLDHRVEIGVVEACSGLRMLTAFVVVAGTMALGARRPGWQKTIVFLSSIPIAVFCNLVRLLITAVLYLNLHSRVAESFFHDFAGVVMMPLAVGLLLAEWWLLDKLVIPDGDDRSVARPVGELTT